MTDEDWGDPTPAMRYRWYQEEAHASVQRELESNRSTLLVMATGTGKTVVFSRAAHEWPWPGFEDHSKQVLVLAHRDELVRQAAATLERLTGEEIGIEKADERSDGTHRIIVGSNQSMTTQRLERLGKSRFGLVVQDECHHALARTYRRALEFFDAKLLGVTATPDRGDEKALAAVFDSVGYLYDIQDGVDDGFLVPFHGKEIELHEIDISGVDTSSGDLAIGQLDEAMLKAVEGITKKTLELGGPRQGIVFWPGVRSAEHADRRFNELSPGSSAVVSGETDPDERADIVKRYQRGELRYLQNCMVLTEGFDAPATSLVAMARPTKSRALMAQCVGRGGRPLAGLLDHLPGKEQAAIRRRAIAASSKPNCLILDFVGNCGKHSLVSPVDVLGGNFTEAEVKEAKKRVASGESNLRDALEAARAALKEMAARTQSKVRASVRDFSPFEVLGIDNAKEQRYVRRFGFVAPSPRQMDALVKWGYKPKDLEQVSKREASKLLDAAILRAKEGLASYGQLKQLQAWGITDTGVPKERARAAMNYLQQKGWGKSGHVDPKAIYDIIYSQRQAGEEG